MLGEIPFSDFGGKPIRTLQGVCLSLVRWVNSRVCYLNGRILRPRIGIGLLSPGSFLQSLVFNGFLLLDNGFIEIGKQYGNSEVDPSHPDCHRNQKKH